MTTKNIEIGFKINGMRETEDGITRITGSLTGLENLSKNTDTAGLTKLNKSIKDLTTGLAGMTGNLQSVTGLLTGLSANLTTASDRVAAALEKMSTGAKTGVAATRTAVEGTAKAVKTSVKEIGDEIDHLTSKAAALQRKSNEHIDGLRYKAIAKQKAEIEAYQRSMLRAVVMQESSERKGSSRQADIDAARSATYSHLYQNNPKALLDRVGLAALASDRGMSTGALNRTYGTSLTQIVRDTTARASVVSHLTDLINKQAIAEMNAAGAAKAALDANKQVGKAEQDRLRNSSEYVKWWTKQLVLQEQNARKAEAAQQTGDMKFNQGLRLKEASRSGTEAIRSRDINANRMSENNFLYENNPQGLLTRVQRARKAALSDVSDADMLSKYGTHLTQIVRDTRAYEGVVAHLTSVIQAAAAAKQNDANATKEQAASLRKARAEAEQLSKRSYAADAKYFAASLTPTRQLSMLQNAYGEYQYGKQSGELNEAEFSKRHGSKLLSIVSDASKYKQELAGIQSAVAAAEEAHLRFGKTGHDLFRGLTSGIGMIWLSWGQILPMLGGFAVSAGVRSMLQVGSQFEHQMGIIKALSQETSGAINVMQRDLLEMSSGSMFALNEMVSGLQALTQAGFSTQDAMKNLKTVMNLSLVGELAPDQAAKFLAGIRSTFSGDPTIGDGLGGVDLTKASNVVAIAATKSQTSISEMMESLRQASTVADEYHLRLTDVSVALQILAERNITGSAAGTAMRNAMEDLVGRTEKARNALAGLKVSLYDAETGATRNPFDVMSDVRSALADATEQRRKRFLQAFTDERGRKLIEAFLAKSDEQIRSLQMTTFRAGENGGFVTSSADEINTSLQALGGQTLNTFRKTAVEAFNEINPGLKELMGNFKELAGSTELKTTLTVISQGLLGLAKVVTFSVSALTQLAPMAAGAAAGFLAWRYAIPIITGVGMGLLKLTGVMYGLIPASTLLPTALMGLIHPATLVAAALVATGAAAAYMWSSTDTAAEKMEDAKRRLEGVSSSLARIRSDVYAKFDQGENGEDSLSKTIDASLNSRLQKVKSVETALTNLEAIQQDFDTRSSGRKKANSEREIELEMFLLDRKRSYLRQQLDEFDQFLRMKGAKEGEYEAERNKFVDAAKNAETQLYEYQVHLSELRIEQTRREVAERSKEFWGLAGLMQSGADKAKRDPEKYVGEGYAKADVAATHSRLALLSKSQVAGQDVTGELAALKAELTVNLRSVQQAGAKAKADLDRFGAGVEREGEGGWVAKSRSIVKNAATEERMFKQLLEGMPPGTVNRTHSIKSLELYGSAVRANQLAKPVTRPFGTNAQLPETGRPGSAPDSGASSLLSLFDEMTGADRSASKLRQLLAGRGKDGDTALKQVFAELEALSQSGNQEASDLLRSSGGTLEGVRAAMLKFVDEKKTFEGKLNESFNGLTRKLRDETARLNSSPSDVGLSEFGRKIRETKERVAKGFDEWFAKQLADAKGDDQKKKLNDGKKALQEKYNADAADAIGAELTRYVSDTLTVARAAAFREFRQQMRELDARVDEFRRGQSQYQETFGAGNVDASGLGTDLRRLFSAQAPAAFLAVLQRGVSTVADFGKALSSVRIKDLVENYDTLLSAAGGSGFSAAALGQAIVGATGPAPEAIRFSDDLYKLGTKKQNQLATVRDEAETKFGTAGYAEGSDDYKRLKSAQDEYIAMRTASIERMHEREVQLAKANYERQQSFAGQFEDVMLQTYKNIASPAETFAETLKKGLGQLQTAFYQMGKGAKVSFVDIRNGFRELVIDMLAQMAAAQMQKAAMGLINSGVSAVGTLIGSFMGAGASTATAATATAPGFSPGIVGSGITPPSGFNFMPAGRAAGGSVAGGVPYLVGEQGYELFVPHTDGSIIPNQAVRNLAVGSGQPTYNVNVTIVDQSVREKVSGDAPQAGNAADLGQQIKAKVMEVLVEQKRTGGVLSR